MKKLLKNKKGFSLVELLIVIAIMGVLAVIAFSMFSGIVANSTRKADEEQANNIQKALTSYMVDTGDSKLLQMKYDSDNDNVVDTEVGTAKDLNYLYVIQALQFDQVVDGKTYIAYLNPKTGTIPSTKDFDVRWSKHIGYSIKVYPSRAKAEVVPVESGSTLTTVLEILD